MTRRHIPVPRANQLLIQLHAAALNHRDLFIRRHLYPGVAFGVPLFADGCGTVREAGSKTLEQQWKGKRVILTPGQGWNGSKLGPEKPYTVRGGTVNAPEGVLQEWIVVDSSEVEEAPGHLTAEEAAALPLTGLTAWRALTTKSQNVAAGRNILITGAGGGVALMALLYARQMGINAYVNAANEERIEQAVKMGARGGVLFHDPSWPGKLYQMLPKERKYLDAVIDGAGADIAAKVLKLLKVSDAKYLCIVEAEDLRSVAWGDNCQLRDDNRPSSRISHECCNAKYPVPWDDNGIALRVR